MRDGAGKEVGWSAVCVKESDRVEKLERPEKADIYALTSPTPKPSCPRRHFHLWQRYPSLCCPFFLG